MSRESHESCRTQPGRRWFRPLDRSVEGSSLNPDGALRAAGELRELLGDGLPRLLRGIGGELDARLFRHALLYDAGDAIQLLLVVREVHRVRAALPGGVDLSCTSQLEARFGQ